MREYKILKALQRGEIIDFEGVKIRQAKGRLKPGDTYIAERNTGPKFLTVKEIKMTNHGLPDFVVPFENEYCFDYWECCKIEIVNGQ